MQLEARFALKKSIILILLGFIITVGNAALYFFGPFYYPMAWVVGLLLMIVGVRGADRRVKLRVGPEGLWYAPWGEQPIGWGEFETFDEFRAQNIRVIQAHAKYPDQLRARLPLLSRANAVLNPKLGRPSFYINPSQLDVRLESLLEVLLETKKNAA